jgi:hypothetical protein
VAHSEHDPEKWVPVFRKDHARTKEERDCHHAPGDAKQTQITSLRGWGNKIFDEWGIKNKVVGAVCRQRPCQPRILKSAHAIR